MKTPNVGLCAIVVVVVAVFGSCSVQTSPLLGARECTYGPSYWCRNLTNAKSCHAIRHCIQTVWEKQQVPVDNDSICQICKNMVGQARDQLRSNETMEELKEVFEGSCKLIPIKSVKTECCKLADDFVPELVETLTSQMNPDQVCSVAGLCNNAEIDKRLTYYYSAALDGTLTEEPEEQTTPAPAVQHTVTKPEQLSCGNCHNIATLITDKFSAANRDDVLENILHLCGEMSSFSDACSSIVLTYFNDIYEHMKENLGASGICHVSGVCSAQYHQHPEDAKMSGDEAITAAVSMQGDDIPCELCEQLVHHLRDLLVANTTEAEFKQVLEGLCKQTKGFKDECLSLADQYYDVIYHSLVDNLDANGACFLIGVCPKGGKQSTGAVDIMPLLPSFPPAEIKVTLRKKLGANEPKFTQKDLQAMQLPIDHLMGAANPSMLVANGELCTLCEYMLHFIQDELATPATEEDIKRTINGICNKMPSSVRGGCHNFIDMYGDAVIALLIQGLNPREVCPKLSMCPPNQEHHDDIEVFNPAPIDESDKPTCPLCLFAVEQAQAKIKNDRSKKNIKNVLDHLCSHLPSKLQSECVDFIETYSNELIDMLITDFKPQEICVSLKLCPKSNSYLYDLGISLEDEMNSEEDTALNEIEDSDEMPLEIVFEGHDAPAPNCWLCEEVIKTAEKRIGKHPTEDDIKKALENACDKLRSNLRPKCHHYIERYGDKIATLVLKEMEPKLICRELGLCLWDDMEDLEIDEALKYDVIAMPNGQSSLVHSDRLTGLDDIAHDPQEPPTCVLCEFVMTKLEADLKNKTMQDEIVHTIETVCNRMPKTVAKSCDKFVEQNANMIIALIGTVPPKQICQRLQLCMNVIESAVTDEVIECGVCHGAVLALMPFFKQHLNTSAIAEIEMVGAACENLPAKYYEICSDMISIYGQSLQHLSEKDVDSAQVCAKIGKCFNNEKASLAFVRISG